MAVLVTGVGYIGAALVQRLLDRGERVVGLDNGFAAVPGAMRALSRHARFRLVRGSVNSPASIERALAGADVTAVFHLAGQSSAHPAAASARYTEMTNLVAPRLVFEAAARHGIHAFVYSSSFRLYGSDLAGVVDESRPYGTILDLTHLTQIYAEKLLEMLAWRFDVPTSVVRLGIVYGLGPAMKVDQRFLTVPNLFCLRAALGQPLVVNPGANRPLGFLHLEDAVEALTVAAGAANAPGARPYNAVSEALTVGEVAGYVAECARSRGLNPLVQGAEPSPAERWRASSRLAVYGFRPRRTMRCSLPPVLDHYLRQAREGR